MLPKVSIPILISGHFWPTSQEGLISRNSGDQDRVLGNELTSNSGDKNHLMLSGFCHSHQPHKSFQTCWWPNIYRSLVNHGGEPGRNHHFPLVRDGRLLAMENWEQWLEGGGGRGNLTRVSKVGWGVLSLSEPPLLAAVCKLLHLLPSRDEGGGQILFCVFCPQWKEGTPKSLQFLSLEGVRRTPIPEQMFFWNNFQPVLIIFGREIS